MVKSIKMKLQKQTFCMGGVSKIMHHYEAHHPQKSCRNEGRQEGRQAFCVRGPQKTNLTNHQNFQQKIHKNLIP